MTQRLVTILALVLTAGALVLAQPPQAPQTAPDGFVPVSALPQADQLPAAPMLIAAYAVVWVVLIVYIWTLWRRLARVERDMADLTRRVQER